MKRALLKHKYPTNDDMSCGFCGELVPVRMVYDYGYEHTALICEDCFWHEEASWDDLPEPKWPEEE